MTPQDVAIRFAVVDHPRDDVVAQHLADARARRRARRAGTRVRRRPR